MNKPDTSFYAKLGDIRIIFDGLFHLQRYDTHPLVWKPDWLPVENWGMWEDIKASHNPEGLRKAWETLYGRSQPFPTLYVTLYPPTNPTK